MMYYFVIFVVIIQFIVVIDAWIPHNHRSIRTLRHISSKPVISTSFRTLYSVSKDSDDDRIDKVYNDIQANQFRPSNYENMKIFDDVLQQIVLAVAEDKPAKALSTVSEKVGFLYSSNLPELMKMLHENQPSYRDDIKIHSAYNFILQVLESLSKEMNTRLSSHQLLLKKLLEAARISSQAIDMLFDKEAAKLLSSDFLVYLDSEIDSHEINSEAQRLLVTIKLKVLDMIGQSKGEDVMAIARIVSEDEVDDMEAQTVAYLRNYDENEKELFVQTLRLMQDEMRKRYQSVDIILVEKLKIMEKVAASFIR